MRSASAGHSVQQLQMLMSCCLLGQVIFAQPSSQNGFAMTPVRNKQKIRLPFKAKAMLHLLPVPLLNPILGTSWRGASAENILLTSMLGSLLGKEEGRRGFPAQQKGSPSPAGPHQRATVGRTRSHAAGASSVGAERRERPEESREEHRKMSPPNCLPGVGCPGDIARRGKLKEELTGRQGETCCWARACLHTELAPAIKLMSGKTRTCSPGWPKVCALHSWGSDRDQSKCP